MPRTGPAFLTHALGDPRRLSTASDGTQANETSRNAQVSADGRTLLFESLASNLVGGDNNGAWDLFTRDLLTGAVARVSLTAGGAQATGASVNARFDQTGTRIVFESDAADLVPMGDRNGARDVFVRDLVSGAVTLVSASPAGIVGNGASGGGVFSADGTRVAFQSLASNLIGVDTNRAADIFVRTLATGDIVRASVAADGTQANGASSGAEFSPDGNRLLFVSSASNLVAGDTNATSDVFVKDLVTGAVTRVSTSATGAEANGASVGARFTADGAGVLFESVATNLVTGDGNRARDVFVKDLATGAVTRLSTDGAGGEAAWSSYDVRQGFGWTAFESDAPLVGGDGGSGRDVHLKGPGGTVLRVLGAGGVSAGADVFDPLLVAGGVIFQSAAANLVAGDTNARGDLFIADLIASVGAGTATQGSAAASGTLFFDSDDALARHTLAVGAPAGAPAGFTAVIVADATGPGTGRIEWRAPTAGFEALAAGETRTVDYGLTLTDPRGVAGTTAVRVTFVGVNDAPVATADAARLDAGTIGFDLGALLLANDRDVDAGDRLTIASVDAPGLAGTLAFDARTGALTYSATGAALAGLTAGQQLVERLSYTVRDATGATAGATATITITGTVPPVVATDGPDVLTAAPGGSILDGGDGDDVLIGGPGADTLVGGRGADRMEGRGGDDVYSVDAAGDVVIERGGEGRDTVVTTIDLTLPDHVEVLILAGPDLRGTGNALDNLLTATGGPAWLDGGAGADTMVGGPGDTTYTVDNAGDRTIEEAGGGTDLVRTSLADYTLAEHVENLVVTGGAGSTARGNALANAIQGMGGNDRLLGMGGDDTLTGNGGNDVLDGGAGADRLRGGLGSDTFVARRGEVAGDFILDFNTTSSGDKLRLEGWGAGTTVTTAGSGLWTVRDGVDGFSETLRIVGVVAPADVLFG